jgi:hypothetical protein
MTASIWRTRDRPPRVSQPDFGTNVRTCVSASIPFAAEVRIEERWQPIRVGLRKRSCARKATSRAVRVCLASVQQWKGETSMAADDIDRLHREFQEAAEEYAKMGNAFLAGSIKGEQILARYTTARDLLDVALRRATIVNAGVRTPTSVGQAPRSFKTALGKYTRVGPMLGQGGTGRVFAATDEDGREGSRKGSINRRSCQRERTTFSE